MSVRPTVSVIVPFAGDEAELDALLKRFAALALGPGDELLIAHNRRSDGTDTRIGRARVLGAGRIHTPAHARNVAAASAVAPWLVFLDADTVPVPDLAGRYSEPAPGRRTAILAGGIEDRVGGGRLVARHAAVRVHLGHERTTRRPQRPYAQTANCAVRADAFAAVRGFDPWARAGEDADLCLRLGYAGYALEERPAARVIHAGRRTVRARLAQLAVHGAGAAWLDRRHPGAMPPPGATELGRRLAHDALATVAAAARGDGGRAQLYALDLAGAVAFEFGRRRDNRPSGAT